MYWGYLSLGLLLFVLAGLIMASAVYDGGAIVWLTGVLALLLAALSTGTALLAWRRLSRSLESGAVWDPAAAPRLGEMLVSRDLISKEDLESALEQQAGTRKRLGQVLVEMELVTYAEVAEALEEQLSRRAWQTSGGSQTETG
jgi:hypothetical protein